MNESLGFPKNCSLSRVKIPKFPGPPPSWGICQRPVSSTRSGRFVFFLGGAISFRQRENGPCPVPSYPNGIILKHLKHYMCHWIHREKYGKKIAVKLWTMPSRYDWGRILTNSLVQILFFASKMIDLHLMTRSSCHAGWGKTNAINSHKKVILHREKQNKPSHKSWCRIKQKWKIHENRVCH